MKTLLKVVLKVVLVVALVLAVAVSVPAVLSNHRVTYVVYVTDVTEDKIYVYDGVKTWAIENVDRWYLDKDSEKIAEELGSGYSFVIEVSGFRIPAIGMYENIVYVDAIGG